MGWLQRLAWGLGVLLLGGCSSASSTEGTWLARLAGEDAWLGITVKGGEGAAFVCGSGDNVNTHTRWMKTEVDNDNVVFRADGWELEVNLSEADAGGQLLEPSGSAIAFDAGRVSDDGGEGLFFGFDGVCGAGLLVLNGTPPDMPEALGAACVSVNERAQVNPVLPIALTNQGIAVRVESTAGEREFFMERATPEGVNP
jgi:hypothetical protein